LQDFEFPLAERFGAGRPRAAQQAGDHRGRQHRITVRGCLDRPQQFIARRVLQQVAGRAREDRI
jgi:hypothetical protein